MARAEVNGSPATGSGAACTLIVDGLDCATCAAAVDRALRGVPGVEEVMTDVVSERVTVNYAPGSVGEEDLKGAVRRAGYRVRESSPAPVTVFQVEGLCCATEAKQIEDRLGRRPDVTRLDFDYVQKRMTVHGRVPAEHVERLVGQLGMQARRQTKGLGVGDGRDRRIRTVLVAGSGAMWLGALLAQFVFREPAFVTVFSLGAMVLGGRYIVVRGLRAARTGALDMNFLMTIAAVGAIGIGEFLEGASAMFLFSLAQLLETRSMDRARNAIRSLMDLSPAAATVLRNGGEHRVSAEEVQPGEIVIVRPGEKVPVDGAVLEGRSSVNQAPITGESIPVLKEQGTEVFAGSVNGEGVLEIRSTRPAEDTTLARIIQSVEEAQAVRAPSQTFVDRFARIYTPAVVAAAVAIAVLPPLLAVGAWETWIYRGLVLLVVACPCALVISTPVTIVSALAGAARRGILIKGGLHLENAGRAVVVALDKTGTLTEGEPTVVEVIGRDGIAPTTVLEWATAAERRSEHPLARAILRYAAHHGVQPAPSRDVVAIPGKGVRATVADRLVYVGTERLFRELGASREEVRSAVGELEARGRTAVLVGTVGGDGEPINICGAIALADRIRENAPEALRKLRAAGVKRIVMLTGDNAGTARAVAESLPEIDEVRSELLPQDKVHAVRELRAEHGRVSFVGDGINDAPALAASDVGIAMGSAGTDAALETADIALMADDLEKLALTIRTARKSEGIIRFNIAISLLTKAVFVVFAVLGWATLWMAVAADMGTSLLVIMNGMRALRVSEPG
jgi:Zn2+/Cd2+-exporting ATPase